MFEFWIDDHEIIIYSTCIFKFTQLLLRNYVMAAPLLPSTKRFKFRCNDKQEFPPFKAPLSPSQQLQLHYNTSCSLKDGLYNHTVSNHFHFMLTTCNPIFDFNELMVFLQENTSGFQLKSDVLCSSLKYSKYSFGVSCEGINRPDLVKSLASIVGGKNHIRFVRLSNINAQIGCEELADVIYHSSNDKIEYWDLSHNHITDIFHLFDIFKDYRANVKSLNFEHCKIDAASYSQLCSSIKSNKRFHGLKQLKLQGNNLTSDVTPFFKKLFRRLSTRNLEVLSIGPIQEPEVITTVLVNSEQPFKSLHICDTTILDGSGADLSLLISTSKMLEELDISGCEIEDNTLISLITSIGKNKNITKIKLGLNRLKLRGPRFNSLIKEIVCLNNKLIGIKLDENGFSQDEYNRLISCLQKMTNLRSLSISGNFNMNSDISLIVTLPLDELIIRGHKSMFLQNNILPIIECFKQIKKLDISGNQIIEGMKSKVTQLIQTSPTLQFMGIEGCLFSNYASLQEFLDAIASSDSLLEILWSENEQIKFVPVDVLPDYFTRKRKIIEKITINRSVKGITSRLSLIDDPILQSIIDESVYALNGLIDESSLFKHAALGGLFGLNFPFETKVNSITPLRFEEYNGTKENPYNDPLLLTTVNETNDFAKSIRVCLIDSLKMRCPDIEERFLHQIEEEEDSAENENDSEEEDGNEEEDNEEQD